jgi:integrase
LAAAVLAWNPSGDTSLTVHPLRKWMHAWLAAGEVRDGHGRPVKVPPLFRHTLATRMINNEIPVTVIRRLLELDSEYRRVRADQR